LNAPVNKEFEKSLNRRKSMMGFVVLEQTTEVRNLASTIKEGDFKREIPSFLDMVDFNQKNNLPPLEDFPDMPSLYKEPFLMINLARNQP
jgi:hypothetical protein